MDPREPDAPQPGSSWGRRLEEITARLEAMQRELEERTPVDADPEDDDPPPAP